MGLLDVDLLRNKLKGLLGGMPLTQMAQGRAEVSQNGLLGALRGMPVFDQKSGEQDMAYAMDAMGPGAIAGTTKLVKGMTKFEKAHKVAQKNAVEMLGLPPNNTAADRAKALGFDTDAYRGSSVSEEVHGKPVWWSEDPAYSSAYATNMVIQPKGVPDPFAGNVMPLKVKMGNAKEFKKFGIGGVPDEGAFGGFGNGVDTGYRRYQDHEFFGDLRGKVWEGLTVPANVRSRFAAFDPKRKDEADLLAAYFGFPMPQERDR